MLHVTAKHPVIQSEIAQTLAVLEQIPQSPEPRSGLKDQILNFLDSYLEPMAIDLQSPPLIHLHSNAKAWNLALKNIQPDIQELGYAARVLKESSPL